MTTATITDSIVSATVTDDTVTATTADSTVTATISDASVSGAEVAAKADKVTSPIDGNLAALDANGNLTDSGEAPTSLGSSSEIAASESAGVTTFTLVKGTALYYLRTDAAGTAIEWIAPATVLTAIGGAALSGDTFTGAVRFPAGSEAAPSILIDDANTGFYSPGGNQVGISNNGSLVQLWTANNIQSYVPTFVSGGGASAPGLGFQGNTDVGIFLGTGPTRFGVAVDGVEYVQVSATRLRSFVRLDFSGTDHAGVRLNNLTTTERDALTPAAGDLIFNETTSIAQCYDGSTWQDLHA